MAVKNESDDKANDLCAQYVSVSDAPDIPSEATFDELVAWCLRRDADLIVLSMAGTGGKVIYVQAQSDMEKGVFIQYNVKCY